MICVPSQPQRLCNTIIRSISSPSANSFQLSFELLCEKSFARRNENNFINKLLFSTDLRTAFDLLDRDQDGMVTPTELQFMLRNLGIEMSDELIDSLMKEASKTGKFQSIYLLFLADR